VGNASGLYNLMRNIGGSVGISVVETILARHEQVHRNDFSRDLAPSFQTLQNSLHQFADVFTTAAGHVAAQRMAIAQVASELNKQARFYSYTDDFRYMALACFACVPLVWSLRRVRRKTAIAGH
jgi:DHA2 family multidrug resistance protein